MVTLQGESQADHIRTKPNGGKIFNRRENEKFAGTLHTLKKCVTDDEKLAFMQKMGYLMKDSLARTYSAKFKGKV